MPRTIPAQAWLALGLIVAIPAFITLVAEGNGVLATLVTVVWGLGALGFLFVPLIQFEAVRRVRRFQAAQQAGLAEPPRRKRTAGEWATSAAVGLGGLAVALGMFLLLPDVLSAARDALPF